MCSIKIRMMEQHLYCPIRLHDMHRNIL